MQLKRNPYHLLLLTALSLVLASFLTLNQNKTLDIHFHDTYFVVAHAHIFLFLAIIVLLLWLLYLSTNKILYSKVLTWIHIIITLLTLAIFILLLYVSENPVGLRRYVDYSNWHSFNAHDNAMKSMVLATSILLFGQVIFLINLVAGLFRRRN